MNKKLQELWERKLKEASIEDRRRESLRDARKHKRHVSYDTKVRGKGVLGAYELTARQFEAYQWVCHWGYSEETAAAMMGASQSAINQLLARIFKTYPELKPTATDHCPSAKLRATAKAYGIKPSGLLCGDMGSSDDEAPGIHQPGKTSWPDGQRRDGENIDAYVNRTRREKRGHKKRQK